MTRADTHYKHAARAFHEAARLTMDVSPSIVKQVDIAKKLGIMQQEYSRALVNGTSIAVVAKWIRAWSPPLQMLVVGDEVTITQAPLPVLYRDSEEPHGDNRSEANAKSTEENTSEE